MGNDPSTREALFREYNSVSAICKTIKARLVEDLQEFLTGFQFVDSVSGRVKSKTSFFEKYESDQVKYRKPFSHIEDLIGIRVLVLFDADALLIWEAIKGGFCQNVEDEHKSPKSVSEFGYEGYHLIQSLPPEYQELGSDYPDFPRVFEIQIKTLFMHAWAEPEHLFRYKQPGDMRPLENDDRRKLAWVAATAWGCDRVYSDLRKELLQ